MNYFDLPDSIPYKEVCGECAVMDKVDALAWLTRLEGELTDDLEYCYAFAEATYAEFEAIWNEEASDESIQRSMESWHELK